MFDLYGSHFEYAGVSSATYGLVFANVTTTRETRLAGDVSNSSIYNRKTVKSYYIGDDRSESALEFDVEIVTEDASDIARLERRTIQKWLFDTPGYRKLFINDECHPEDYVENINGSSKRLYLNCRFINPSKIESDSGIIGFKATMICDSNMAWQEAATYTYTLTNSSSSSSSTISVTVDSDLKDYIYPKVTFTMGASGGDVIITNLTDNAAMDAPRLTEFTDIAARASVVMNGEINYVSSSYYTKFANKNFIRLLDGVNSISVSGDVSSITFEYANRRWL